MADASRDTAPSGWGDAFAALPLDAPPASRWPAIEAALDARNDDGRHDEQAGMAPTWPRRAAWAAVLAVAALPALFWLRPTTNPAPSRSPFTATTAIEPAASAAAAPQRVAVAPASDAPARTPPRTATSTSASRSAAPPKAARIARAPVAVAVTDARTAIAQPKPWPRARMTSDHEDGASVQAAFEPYYKESARLEGLIAATRDPRVGSGPAASLAGALDAELAAVDARIAQSGLDVDQRLALWRERVDLLRISAELESQLRLLAAEGDALDGALVRVD